MTMEAVDQVERAMQRRTRLAKHTTEQLVRWVGSELDLDDHAVLWTLADRGMNGRGEFVGAARAVDEIYELIDFLAGE